LSVIIESATCSSPADFSTRFCVSKVSFPILLKVAGPTSTTEEVTPPAVF
jgi:hypothetical protein